jgi:hypothetical protein
MSTNFMKPVDIFAPHCFFFVYCVLYIFKNFSLKIKLKLHVNKINMFDGENIHSSYL